MPAAKPEKLHKQKITVTLDPEILRKTRQMAFLRGKNLSAMVEIALAELTKPKAKDL